MKRFSEMPVEDIDNTGLSLSPENKTHLQLLAEFPKKQNASPLQCSFDIIFEVTQDSKELPLIKTNLLVDALKAQCQVIGDLNFIPGGKNPCGCGDKNCHRHSKESREFIFIRCLDGVSRFALRARCQFPDQTNNIDLWARWVNNWLGNLLSKGLMSSETSLSLDIKIHKIGCKDFMFENRTEDSDGDY